MTRRPIVAAAVLAGVFLAGPALAACSGGTATPAADQGTTRSIAGSPVPATTAANATAPGASSPAGVQPPPSPAASVSTPAAGSGIAGITTMISVCPAQRAESPCPARPVPVRLSVVDSSTSAVVATVTSNANGYFAVALKPGRYVLHPLSIAGGPPHPQMPTLLTVTVGHYTTVTLRYDSGIR